MKSSPAVTCSAHHDHVITVSNGPVTSSSTTQLVYSIFNIRHDETCQNEDLLAISQSSTDGDDEEGITLRNIFWSTAGDPCIYDSAGVLLTLVHWRTPGQAKWVPLLDTKTLDRLKSGKKEETYWPVAVSNNKFHAIILKGGEKSPYFPRPLLSEFEFNIPVTLPVEKPTAEDDEEAAESNAAAGARLEESFIRSSLLHSLLDDLITSRGDFASHTDKTEAMRRELEIDKILLQLLAVECREGEDRGMKALEVVKLMRDRTGRMVEAASKVAGRWGLSVLEEKIRTWAEERLRGVEEQ